MNRFFYFKVTFLAITAGLFAGLFVYGLIGLIFFDEGNIEMLLLKSLVTSLTTGLLLGILNMFFKIGNFQSTKFTK